jgi:hypothetical protein
VRQEGPGLILSFKAPRERADGSELSLPLRYEILCIVREGADPPPSGAGPSTPPAPRSSVAPSARAAAILMKSARPAGEGSLDRPGEQVEVRLDREAFPGVRLEGSQLTLGVALIDAEGRRAPPAELVSLEPVPPLPAPHSLEAVLRSDGVSLAWQLPDLSGYPADRGEIRVALYRWPAGELPPPRPVKRLERGAVHAIDPEPLERLVSGQVKRLAYSVRLAVGDRPPRRESLPAGPVEVDVKDTFAPSAPRGLAAVAEPGLIRLFWYPSEEADLAGYRLSRSESESGEFHPLTQEPVLSTSYEDRNVSAGRTYYYRLTAIDRESPANESAPSGIVSEIAMAAEEAPHP